MQTRASNDAFFFILLFFGFLCSQLDAGERALVRGMRSQVERMMNRHPESCDDEEEDDDDDEEEEEEEEEEDDASVEEEEG